MARPIRHWRRCVRTLLGEDAGRLAVWLLDAYHRSPATERLLAAYCWTPTADSLRLAACCVTPASDRRLLTASFSQPTIGRLLRLAFSPSPASCRLGLAVCERRPASDWPPTCCPPAPACRLLADRVRLAAYEWPAPSTGGIALTLPSTRRRVLTRDNWLLATGRLALAAFERLPT